MTQTFIKFTVVTLKITDHTLVIMEKFETWELPNVTET